MITNDDNKISELSSVISQIFIANEEKRSLPKGSTLSDEMRKGSERNAEVKTLLTQVMAQSTTTMATNGKSGK